MFILNELITDSSYFRKYFIYLDELIDVNMCKIYTTKLMKYHIIIINHVFFGINKRKLMNDKQKWKNVSKILKDFVNSIDNIICMFIGDCHEYSFIGGIRSIAISCKKYKVDYIISLYDDNNEINKLKYLLSHLDTHTQFICANNMIKSHIFKDYELPKTYDIVLYGAVNNKYPLRQKLYHLLKSKK